MTDSTFSASCVHCGTIGGHAAICHRGPGVTTITDRGEGGHYTKWKLAVVQPTSLPPDLLDRYDNSAGLTVAMPADLRSTWKRWMTDADADESVVVDGAPVEQQRDSGGPSDRPVTVDDF